MRRISDTLIAILALEHIYILYIEMFAWNTPKGHAAFNLTPEFAAASAPLAANQGLYNGFLAAGLIWGLVTRDRPESSRIKIFFSACVMIAGLYGGATALPKIYFLQALPGFLALVFTCLAARGSAVLPRSSPQ